MAWTWSAPQRGTVACTMASIALLPNRKTTLNRAVECLGRGDAMRGLCILFASFLTIAGAAAPNLSPLTMATILCLSGAAVLFFVASMPSASLPHAASDAPTAVQPVAAACLYELLNPHKAASSCDRAAFARLTSHMSHELRTPLNAILGFSELMSHEVFGPLGSSNYAAYARDIHASGLSLLKSADDALAITSLLTASEQHRSATANAASACFDALAFHATGFAAKGLTACCTVDPDAEVLANSQAVRQLLINILADASQRAKTGATISLASRTDSGHVEILVTISSQTSASYESTESFSMLLARTLCELSAAQLILDDAAGTGSSQWHAAVRFQHVTQNDFFKAA
jgi:signal transduction histidine kinase